MRCESPSLQEALLGEARGGAVRTAACVQHLAACSDCRDALALLQRAREHQRPDLSAEELSALRLRVLPRLSWQQRPAARLRWPGLSLGFAVGVSAAVSLAAGSYFVWRGGAQGDEAPASRAAPREALPRPVAKQTPAPAPAPALVEAPNGPAWPETPPRSSVPGVRSGSPAARAAASGHWSDAASALKEDDLPRAERALGQLAGDQDSVTRDSAQLALAEIWMKNQQVPRARAALERLARSGATPAIRQRAARLLAELPR
jgi:hypothetical protein